MSDKLRVSWSKIEHDHVIHYPKRCDGALMNYIMGDILLWGGVDGKRMGWTNYKRFNLLEELDKRGYDLTTLKFEIKLKENE